MAAALPVIVVLDNVRSLHNVGAIFRSSEAAGVQKIVLGGLTPVPPRHEIEKTALGATQTLQWQHVKDLIPYLNELKEEGYALYALEQTEAARNLLQTKLSFPLALIVGHEREGVEPEILQAVPNHLEIPMRGTGVHSLNVSAATSIALYESVRQFCYNE